MQDKSFVQRAVKPLLAAALATGVALPFAARAEQTVIKAAAHPAQAVAPRCDAPLDMVRFAYPLSRVARKLAAGETVTIVAIGSSSTAGAGASSPAASYPSRLAVELKERFPKQSIVVINRGVNGEEVGDMLKRFDAVVEAKPDLVLWQLGTNSVIREHTSFDHAGAIREGLRKVRAIGADVVLIDPQYVPRVIAKREDADKMVALISTTAKKENVDLFRRFEVMKRWVEVDHLGFESFVSADGLHLNDWSYACMAKGMAVAISEAVKRPVVSATASPHLVP